MKTLSFVLIFITSVLVICCEDEAVPIPGHSLTGKYKIFWYPDLGDSISWNIVDNAGVISGSAFVFTESFGVTGIINKHQELTLRTEEKSEKKYKWIGPVGFATDTQFTGRQYKYRDGEWNRGFRCWAKKIE